MSTAVIDLLPIDLLDPQQEPLARRWMEVHAGVQRELFGDKGSPFSLEELQAFHRAPERRRVDRAAYLDGELAGALEVIMPTTDNLELAQRMSTDAPVDDLAMEEEAWDAERLLGTLDRLLQSGRRVVETVARHVPTGDLVGFTQVNVSATDPSVAYQQDTLVLTEHRGHALGLRLKAANALLVMDSLPDVASIRTWNSSTNDHMLAVNRALGYVVDGYSREWQKVLS